MAPLVFRPSQPISEDPEQLIRSPDFEFHMFLNSISSDLRRVEYNHFSILLNPVIVISRTGEILYANDACEASFGMTPRQLRKSSFPAFLNFDSAVRIDLKNLQTETKYIETSFKTGTTQGTIRFAMLPIESASGEDRFLVSFADVTLEKELFKKYREQLIASGAHSDLALTAQAALILAENTSSRKDSEMAFLIRFYANTRFIVDSNLIARKFLQQTCDELGFLSGIYFSIQPQSKTLRVGSSYSLVDAMKVAEEKQKLGLEYSFESDSIFATEMNVQSLTAKEIREMGLENFYRQLSIEGLQNAIVITIRRGDVPVGQFHLLNFATAQDVDPHTFQFLSSMLDPLTLTFENANLYSTSITDELTQIYNVRYFRTRLQTEIDRAKRYNRPLSLIMLDIDFFKKVNDTYGHSVGDTVIKTVARILRTSVREVDVVARYGGEEMAAILPETDEKSAIIVAERIRQKIQKEIVETKQGSLNVTASFGISQFPLDGVTMDLLIDFADQALYLAKHSGRNCVKIYTEVITKKASGQ